MQAKVKANKPQGQFLGLPHKFKAFVGGFGTGKTWVGGQSQLMHFLKFPGVNQGYFAPTYSMIRDIYYPTLEEVAYTFKLRIAVKEGNKEIHVYNGRKYLGLTKCRSMDKPGSIVGFKVGRALVDEIDTMKIDKATDAWRKIIARLRHKHPGIQNGIDVVTTPEGFKFVYKQFYGNKSPKYGMIQASTYDNELNLPEDYIQSLLDTYPPELIEAYLKGQFVNLTSGTVYRNYDRKKCNSFEKIEPGDELYLGQDFNVYNMATVVYVKRKNPIVGEPDVFHAVDELHSLADTPSMLQTVGERYPEHNIVFYPDSSGKNTSSKGASISDIKMIEAEYSARYKTTNPLVKDRVLSMNTAFTKALVKVNALRCPEFVKCLEQQAYDKNGAPDKKSGHDHMNDAGTYPIAYEMPILKPVIETFEETEIDW